jgi:type IV secretion system protein VirD4
MTNMRREAVGPQPSNAINSRSLPYIAASGGFISIAVAIGMSVWRAREAKKVETYGSARWGEKREVPRRDCSVPMAWCSAAPARLSAPRRPEHVLCFAPTRSGKGVGLVVPSLLTWPGSASSTTSRARTGSSPPAFAPSTAACCCSIRPNEIVRLQSAARSPRGEWEVRDVQNIADILVDPEGSSTSATIGRRPATALLVGAILHVLYAEKDKTLAGVAAFLSDPKRPIERRSRHDDNAASRRGRAASRHRLAPRASCSTNPTTSARACCPPPCRFSASTAIPSWPR